jgi:hypothetical protein
MYFRTNDGARGGKYDDVVETDDVIVLYAREIA